MNQNADTDPKEPLWFTWVYPPESRDEYVKKNGKHLKDVRDRFMADTPDGTALRSSENLLVEVREAKIKDELVLEDAVLRFCRTVSLIVILSSLLYLILFLVCTGVFVATRSNDAWIAMWVMMGISSTLRVCHQILYGCYVLPFAEYVRLRKYRRKAELALEAMRSADRARVLNEMNAMIR